MAEVKIEEKKEEEKKVEPPKTTQPAKVSPRPFSFVRVLRFYCYYSHRMKTKTAKRKQRKISKRAERRKTIKRVERKRRKYDLIHSRFSETPFLSLTSFPFPPRRHQHQNQLKTIQRTNRKKESFAHLFVVFWVTWIQARRAFWTKYVPPMFKRAKPGE